MSYLLSKFAAIGTVSALSLGFVGAIAHSAQAAILTYNFEVTLISGSLVGAEPFTGTLSFDSSNLIDVGFGIKIAAQPRIEFNFLDQTFSERDDVNFVLGIFPTVRFADDTFLGLDYIISETDPVNPVRIPGTVNSLTFLDSFFVYSTPEGYGRGRIIYTLVPIPDLVSVPEPGLLTGLAATCLSLFLSKRWLEG